MRIPIYTYIKPCLVILLLGLAVQGTSQTILDFNMQLGRGVNYGNMFEAPSEGEWGNPWSPNYPDLIASLGFSHVRMPINWTSDNRTAHSPPYTIKPEFLERISEVVDATLNAKLMVVINMHHHEELFEDPDGQKDRFLAQWKQIGDYFKDYPDSLVFEILNEPHNNLDATKWNMLASEALEVIRENNPERPVLLGTAQYNSVGTLSQLEVPDDENIILTIHYYNPFQFTHQGAEWVGESADDWLGTKWLDSDIERTVVESELAPLVSWSEEMNIPVHIGEFGAYSTADMDSRERWTTFLARYFESNDWSWAYWEFSAGFGIYNPATDTYNTPLVDALLENEMPEPLVYERKQLYESDFSGDMDGWFLNVFEDDGAIATLSRAEGDLKVTIDKLGTQNWHIQLIRSGIALEKDKKYSIQFTGKASESRPATLHIGQNSGSYTSYGSTTATLETEVKTFTGSVDMQVNDPQARIVIDLGGSLADFTLTGVMLEELILPETIPGEVTSVNESQEFSVYPNPSGNRIRFNNFEGYNQVTLLNVHGQKISHQKVQSGWNEIDLSPVQSGIYFLQLTSTNDRKVVKIIRN